VNDRPDMHRDTPTMGITIGAMSRATGIPANTLRTWERRYGFPEPDRSASGQRLYDPSLIGHLRLVAHALEQGHRPRQVLPLSEDQLAALLGSSVESSHTRPSSTERSECDLAGWIEAARALDGRALDAAFKTEAARLGLLRFLSDRVTPFLSAIGDAWRAGDVEVYQEHWASERLRRFLVESWEPLSRDAVGPKVVCATLPGDQHELGLHMAVTIMAMCGWRVVYLGRDTPVEEVASAVKTQAAACALVSISAWTDADLALGQLEQLRGAIQPGVAVVSGGAGAPQDVPGVTGLDGLESLYAWASGNG